MKILFIFPSSLRSIGGVSAWAREILPRLSSYGINVEVFASNYIDGGSTNMTIDILHKESITYEELPVIKLLSRTYYLPFTKDSLEKIKKSINNADAVYIQNIWLGQDAQLMDILVNKNVIVGYHTPIFNRKLLHDLIVRILLLKRWKKFRYHHVLTLEQEKILSSYGYRNIHLIYNGVDIDKYSNNDYKKNDHFTVLYIGRLVKNKGVDLILECVKELCLKNKYKDMIFIMAGIGALKDKVIEYEGMYSNLCYKGFISEEEKIELYNSSHVFVLPSKAEGLPLTILESMASGLVIISSSDYDILPKANIVLEKLDKKDLLTAICYIYDIYRTHFEKYVCTGMENKKMAEAMDWDIIVKELEKMFYSISYKR